MWSGLFLLMSGQRFLKGILVLFVLLSEELLLLIEVGLQLEVGLLQILYIRVRLLVLTGDIVILLELPLLCLILLLLLLELALPLALLRGRLEEVDSSAVLGCG